MSATLNIPTVSRKRLHWLASLLTTTWFLATAAVTVANDANELAVAEEAAMQAAVKNVSDSVVRIETVGGLEKVGKVLVSSAPTTGLVISEDGYIVSSAFNFIQKPTSILVTLPNGKRSAAEIVARDRSRQIVLLKLEDPKGKLTVPTATPADEVRVGYWAIAVGRTLEADTTNISVGVVSAVNRIWGKAIQTDSKVSPLNYGGPLVDIQGRVLGVLVPMSPQENTEVAGAEWYDSGIGFAVPLEDIFAVLDKLKTGDDLYRGLLGVTIKGKNAMADPAILAHAMPGTPAAKAGLKSGDKIVELNGIQIGRHDDLKQAIGRKYAGEVVKLVAMRGEEKLDFEITLTDRVDPYELPMLGILPMRVQAEEDSNLVVRGVLPKSPAEEAGLQPGDELIGIGEEKFSKLEDWFTQIADRKPDDEIQLRYAREGKEKTATVKLAKQPEGIPDKLPAAHDVEPPADAAKGTGLVEIKLPEEASECFAYVPEDYTADVPHGVVVLLTAPGEYKKSLLTERWKDACEEYDLIVLAPQPADDKRWNPTEVDFVRKTLDDVTRNFNVDEHRVIVHGHQAGGSLGYRFAFGNRDVVRGIANVDVTVPLRLQARGNDPQERMSIYIAFNKDSKLAKRINANAETFREFKFPVTMVEQSSEGYLTADEITDLARWIDTLDRL